MLVVNSAHLASMASPDEHRWLPIFWALDYFKTAAARDVEERGDWMMEPVDEKAVPAADKAAAEFTAAMDAWDEAAADAAIAGLARTAGANEIYEHLFRYGMRDFRSIGHKAIYVANSLRTLNCIGWQHAEPVLRSLAYALLMHEGDNPRDRNDAADVPYRKNLERVAKLKRAEGFIPSVRPKATTDAGATTELLASIRNGSNDDSCNLVVEQLNRRRPPAIDLGRPPPRRRRAPHAPTRHRLAPRGDDQQRAPLRLRNERRRRDAAAPHPAERRVPADVPQRDGRPRQSASDADRRARRRGGERRRAADDRRHLRRARRGPRQGERN